MKKRQLVKGVAVCLTVAFMAGTVMEASASTVSGSAVSGETVSGDSVSGGSVSGGAVSGGAISGGAVSTPIPDISLYKPATPTVGIKGGSERIRVTWKKIADADGYYVYTRASDEAQYVKTKEVKDGDATECVVKSLTQNKKYYARVSAYRKVGNQIVESALSAIVSAKTKSVSATSKSAKLYSTKKKFKKSPAYKKYTKMVKKLNYSKSFAIPGMKTTNVAGFACTTMVPQAVCHAGSYLLVSAYDSKGVENSVIYIVSKAAKSYIATIVLPSKAQVGGMAYDGENVWISKGKSVACFPYSFVTETVNSGSAYKELNAYRGVCKVEKTASYLGYYKGTLWVGTFSTAASFMDGYSIANKTSMPSLSKTYTMKMPSKTQGIAFTSDGTLIVSRSNKAKESKSGYVSQIRTYSPSYDSVGADGKVLKNKVIKETALPPKAEGVAVYGSYVYTLFSSCQSSACKNPVDRVLALKISKLI